MSLNPPALPYCQSCARQVRVVFLVDSTGVVYTAMSKGDKAFLVVIGSVTKELPDAKKFTLDTWYQWVCETCVREKYATSNS